MAIFNQALIDGAHAVVRAVEHHARQDVPPSSSVTSSPANTITSSLSSAISSTATAVASTLSSSITSNPPLTESPTSSPSPTPTDSGSGDQGSGTSNPLLFFVALGFGVVFTNLWIIVGVKYCFRYNARNRQLRGLDENGEPINLENMPTRPHRRRREKKLMTMDEVNEKFPMVKYKTWVAGRAREGLPTTGGVSRPGSRANSVRSVEGIVPELPPKERDSIDEPRRKSASPVTIEEKPKDRSLNHEDSTSGAGTTTAETTDRDDANNENALTQTQTVQTLASGITKGQDGHASDDEDDEHIDAALPPELMGTSGDTCAICIDTLEDDDDVRGLTCGHAFHAVCLDPWLTNRRACCPLCKADYYTPKPRPSAAEGDPNHHTSRSARDPSRNDGRMNMPRSPQRSFNPWTRGPSRLFLGGGRLAGAQLMGPDNRRTYRPQRPQRRRTEQSAAQDPPPNATENEGWLSRVRGRFPPFRMNQLMRRNNEAGQSAPNSEAESAARGNDVVTSGTTPSQLEAGVRSPAT